MPIVFIDCQLCTMLSLHFIFLVKMLHQSYNENWQMIIYRLECIAIPFSRESSGLRDRTWVSCIVGRVFTVSAIEKSLAPTLLHPSFKGRTNRKPVDLVTWAVLTCHHYQTSFLWLGWRRMLPFFKAKMEVSRELLIKSWMPLLV